MDKIINVDKVKFRLDIIMNSIITSLEKNPDINGIPIKANLLIPKIDRVNGYWMKLIPIIRMSW